MQHVHDGSRLQGGAVLNNNWRPKGWITWGKRDKEFDGRLPTLHSAYEAGANAMLEVLRATGYHVDRAATFCSLAEHCTLSNKDNTGNYLFIPDDDVPFDECRICHKPLMDPTEKRAGTCWMCAK